MQTSSIRSDLSPRWLYRALVLLVVAGAVVHIGSIYSGNRTMFYATKPGTMLAIIALAALRGAESRSRYATLVLIGLICSMVGDILLMLPADQFIGGLVSFLVAHLLYIGAFRTGLTGWSAYWIAAAIYAAGGVVYWLLWPGLGDLKIPVFVYLVVILTMAWQSVARWTIMREGKSLLAVAGAVLFVVSDTMIAFNRFSGPFELADGLIMGTYFAAQLLIALSV
jgi:uncharacterized membrane protein YhhN